MPKIYLILFTTLFYYLAACEAFRKVIVPAVFDEWQRGPPSWTSRSMQSRHGYEVYIYQKLNASAPNYISNNRGTEAGVYLRYILDHYNDFPDVAIFVHARPQGHLPYKHDEAFAKLVTCISPNATYYNFNWFDRPFRQCRNTTYWGSEYDVEIWAEQCWRDIIKIAWNIRSVQLLNILLPPTEPISVCADCCQQFIISRNMILKRPKSYWSEMYKIIGQQSACHLGLPDYENLFSYHRNKSNIVGPEPSNITLGGRYKGKKSSYGAHTQGHASEYLSHVIYANMSLILPDKTLQEACNNFLPNCLGSPCNSDFFKRKWHF